MHYRTKRAVIDFFYEATSIQCSVKAMWRMGYGIAWLADSEETHETALRALEMAMDSAELDEDLEDEVMDKYNEIRDEL